MRVRHELPRIEYGEVRSVLKLLRYQFLVSPNQHLLQEQSVVRSRSYQANLHLILGIPPSKLVDHKKAFTHVQKVNGSLLIRVKSLHGHGNIDAAPVDCIACLII